MTRNRSQPLPSWPHFDDEEVEAVSRVLRSGKVNQWTGAEVHAFEDEYARSLGMAHAIALANGTVSLELALRAAGIGPGDDVIVPSRTFIATAAAAVTVGARPVCADVDPDSGNLSAKTLRAALTPRTRAVIPVHLAGWPVRMDEIMAVAAEHKLFVVEDCAQAHGATYKGRPVGSFGHAASFSFCQDKIMTTGGEGGLLATNDEALGEMVWSLKDHGKDPAEVVRKDHPPGFRWLHARFGTNARMTEMQAALGRIQLRHLAARVARRRDNAARLSKHLASLPSLRVPRPPPDAHHAYYRYQFEVVPERLAAGWTRDQLMLAVEQAGIPCSVGSCSEIYLERAFQAAGLVPEVPLPHARRFTQTSLMVPVHHRLSDADVDDIATAVRNAAEKATTPH